MNTFLLSRFAPPLVVPYLEAGPVVLRPFSSGDLSLIEAAGSDPYIPSMTSVPRHFSESEGRAYLARQSHQAEDGHGFPFVIAPANEPSAGSADSDCGCERSTAGAPRLATGWCPRPAAWEWPPPRWVVSSNSPLAPWPFRACTSLSNHGTSLRSGQPRRPVSQMKGSCGPGNVSTVASAMRWPLCDSTKNGPMPSADAGSPTLRCAALVWSARALMVGGSVLALVVAVAARGAGAVAAMGAPSLGATTTTLARTAHAGGHRQGGVAVVLSFVGLMAIAVLIVVLGSLSARRRTRDAPPGQWWRRGDGDSGDRGLLG